MQLSADLVGFLASPVMMIVGTCDAANRPSIARGSGAAVSVGVDTVSIFISRPQWPQTIANLRENGRMAITFARPSDYVSYQLKGKATLRDADATDIVRSERYTADMFAVLSNLGVAVDLATPWFARQDIVVAILEPAEIYVQTPGPRAGTAL